MAIEFKLPDVGEGVAEGEIVQWLVQAGDHVDEHQSVVEVMTDKATVEIPAPSAGTIKELRAEPGQVVPVGDVIFVLEAGEAGQRSGEAGQRSGEAGRGSGGAAPKAEQERPGQPQQEQRRQPAAPAARQPQPAGSGAGGGGRTIEFQLPDVGEGVAEGEIVQWLVAEGDEVAEHQSVVEVMTDKATVEVPAPAAGRVTRLLAAAGDTVPVGEVIFHLQTAGAGAATEPAGAPQHEPVAAGAATSSSGGAARATSAPAQAAPRRAPDEKVLAVPSARRVARELGIDLSQVPGTGRNGVVRRADVEAFHQSGAAAAPAQPAPAARRPAAAAPAAAPAEEETRIPFRGVRRKIAEAMARSKFTAPHFTVVEEVDVTELVALRQRAKAIGEQTGVKVTYMPFIMKATALGLARHTMLNGRLDEEAQEIVRFRSVHLGIAMDTDNGLIVPVIRDVQSKGVLQLAEELAELAARTRAGKVRPEELRGSTFTITNAGNIGGTFATPIINYPDIAILGVHRIMKKPGVVEAPEGDRIEVRQYMNFSCSVDHRLADGADGARFLVHLKTLLETPGLLAL